MAEWIFGLFGAIVGWFLGFFSKWLLYERKRKDDQADKNREREEKIVDLLKIVKAAIIKVREDLNLRIHKFGPSVDFDGYNDENEDWIIREHRKVNPNFGPESPLDIRRFKWYYGNQKDIDISFLENYLGEMRILPEDMLYEIIELFEKKLPQSNKHLEQSRYILKTEAEGTPVLISHSALYFIKCIMEDRDTANALIEKIEAYTPS